MVRHESRMQLALALVIGLLLVANLFTLALVALAPEVRGARAPVLFALLVVTVVVSVPSVLLLPRWLLSPYRQLVEEAERAGGPSAGRPRDETEFVLETFQGVVGKLRAQQRELERLREAAAARAADAERFGEKVVANLPSGLLAFDSSGRLTVANAPAISILSLAGRPSGLPHEEVLSGAPGLARLVSGCLATGEVFRREEVTTRDTAGRARRLGVTVAPIDPGRGGVARGAICLLTDITEVASLREALARKKNLESLGEMSAGLAHEYKNALATLHGYAQLLQNDNLAPEARSSAASALLREVRGLSEMITSFLDFARPKPLDLAPVSLAGLVEECAGELRPLYDERGVELSVEGGPAEVRADERMLRQALLNLLRNAAEAIPPDSPLRAVKVRWEGERDGRGVTWTRVEIEDTGAGIAEDDMGRIFIPFFTTKAKGHGVGLALAHRIVTDHGGTLSAAEAAGGGAVFTLRLPCRESSRGV